LRDSDIASVVADAGNAEAWKIVGAFQREHVIPTITVAQGLAVLAHSVDGAPPVPRIKRAERIIEKIARGSTALDRLQDIGGCRIIVPDLAAQRSATEQVLAMGHQIVDVDDYVSPERESPFESNSGGPKGSGYRAIHVIQRVDDRLIETQIRTISQHRWAAAAERAEQITGFPLKFGQADADLLEYFRVASQISALEESRIPVDDELVDTLADLRERIRPYYRRKK
jgi:hypothetical protein